MTRRDDPSPSDDATPRWLTAFLTDDQRSRFRSAVVTATTVVGLYKQGKSWFDGRREDRLYTVSVEDTDEIYLDVHEWILDQLPKRDQRSVNAFTRRAPIHDDVRVTAGGPPMRRQVMLRYDGSQTQKVLVEGHRVEVHVDAPSVPRSDDERGRRYGKPGSIVFTAATIEGREAVIRLLLELTRKHEIEERTTTKVFIASKWGDWHGLGTIKPRPLEQVILAKDVREDLLSDMQLFLGQEEAYRRLGVPWHRGYLLYGPPGTGKSSVFHALATELDLALYFVPLSDLEGDTDLIDLLARVDQRSLLLLEDVDVAHVSHERVDEDGDRENDGDEKGVTLSGLLNALDGIITPHGLITAMTTNYYDVLDDALTRPGRADWKREITYADDDQLRRLVVAMLGVDPGPLPTVTPEHEIAPAEVVEVIKSHLHHDPADALEAILSLIRARVAARSGTPAA